MIESTRETQSSLPSLDEIIGTRRYRKGRDPRRKPDASVSEFLRESDPLEMYISLLFRLGMSPDHDANEFTPSSKSLRDAMLASENSKTSSAKNRWDNLEDLQRQKKLKSGLQVHPLMIPVNTSITSVKMYGDIGSP